MLRTAKLLALRTAAGLGLERLLLSSPWRKNRLLILCYHGISLADEHEWNSSLFMPAALLRERFETLRQLNCNVLPLEEAIERTYAGTLPPRSVAITFDDGNYDFRVMAMPVIREFGFPVTLYFTTYYSNFNRPVFDVMASYLLWKARGRRLEWPDLLPKPVLLDDTGRMSAYWNIRHHALSSRFDARQKDALLSQLAERLGIDYDEIRRRRLLHLMTADEAREAARAGVDFQLHTHRHRVSRRRELVQREIDDNRACLDAIGAHGARHFCYPSGCVLPELLEWLPDMGVKSATTCGLGLVNRDSKPLLLPRLVDTCNTSAVEFQSWVAGIPAFLPHRRAARSDAQIFEAETEVAAAKRDAYSGAS